MINLLLAAACTPDEPPSTIDRHTPVHGEGAFEGMVAVPAANVRAGSYAGPPPPPPRSVASPPPTFACTADEVRQDQCPALAHDPLPVRVVRVAGFWIDEAEVSQAKYGLFLAATGYRPPHVEEAWAEADWNWEGSTPRVGTEDHPVVLTSWYDAREYCGWRGARLPTETEWHLAARGPTEDQWAYPWGKAYVPGRMNIGKLEAPNYDDSEDGFLTTSPVGHYPEGASRYGALDLFGNAWEWVADLRTRSWTEVTFAADGPHTGTLGLYAGARGFSYFADPRVNLTIDHNAFPMELRRKTSGFRCARSAAVP